MSDASIVFATEYSDRLVAQAALTFRDYLFKRYGLLLIAACAINALGAWLAFSVGVTGIALVGLLFLAVLGPTWLLYQYFIRPSQYRAKLRRALPPHSRVALAAASVSLEVQGQEAVIPWSVVKAVVEAEALFLLVVSPFAFTFVPKPGLPEAAYEALHARAGRRAA